VRERFDSTERLPASQRERFDSTERLPASQRERFDSTERLPASQRERFDAVERLPASQRERFDSTERLPASHRERLDSTERLLASQRERFDSTERLPASHRERFDSAERLPASHRERFDSAERLPAAHRERFDSTERLPAAHRETFDSTKRLPASHRKTFDAAGRLLVSPFLGRASLPPAKMGLSAKPPPKIVVVLKLPEYEVPLLIVRARGILQAMTGNKWFPSPFPTLAEVEAATDDLFASETKTLTRVMDSVSERDAKRMVLVSLLQRLAAYVEAIAIANPEHGAEIVESAGMYLKKAGGPRGRTFHAKQTRAGEIQVFAPRAAVGAAYEFQYSLDGGRTWLGTPQQIMTTANVTIAGLPPHSMVHLRYRATVKNVTGDWSQTIAIMVE